MAWFSWALAVLSATMSAELEATSHAFSLAHTILLIQGLSLARLCLHTFKSAWRMLVQLTPLGKKSGPCAEHKI